MIIADTSALVLNFTSTEIWKTENARNYFKRLDISSADDLLILFNKQDRYMHTQTVTNRKYFVRKSAVEFLEKHSTKENLGQVIILAAGIAPLSVEIATLFPKCKVFDVDKYQMIEKEVFLNGLCPNICFLEIDITDISSLLNRLKQNGWQADKPSLVIMEGIVYYLTTNDLKQILKAFSSSSLVCDFCLRPENVQEKTRIFGIEVFRKIKMSIKADFINFYTEKDFIYLLRESNFTNPETMTMNKIQIERTGETSPFDFENSGWIVLVKSDKNSKNLALP